MMGHLSPNHLNNDLQKVRILNVSGFGMVGFQIPTVIQKAQKLGLSKKNPPARTFVTSRHQDTSQQLVTPVV